MAAREGGLFHFYLSPIGNGFCAIFAKNKGYGLIY